MKRLTPKQEAFIRAYLTTGNATQSAKVAGYSEKTAYAIGAENLKKPEIQEIMDNKRDEQWEVFRDNSFEALSFLLSIARDENAPFSTRLDACNSILDRAGYKPAHRNEVILSKARS